MSKKVVSLRLHQKEGAKVPAKGLSLADITITWGPPDRQQYVTGRTVAKLISYASTKHPNLAGHDPQSGTLRLGPMLRGLGGWLFPDAGSPSDAKESEWPPKWRAKSSTRRTRRTASGSTSGRCARR